MTIDGATLSVGFGVIGAESVITATEAVAGAFSAAAAQGIAAYEQTELLKQSLSALYSQELLTLDSTLSLSQARRRATEESVALTEMISTMAIQSPYSAAPLAQASQQALSYGLLASAIQDVTAAREQDAMTVQRMVAGMTDFSAATAGSADNVVELTALLGKMYSSGTMYTEDVWQLQDRALPALRILSEHYGVTTQGLRDMLAAGQVDAREAVEAILDFIETYYAGAAKEASGTIAGIRASLADLREYTLRDVMTPMIESARPYLLDLVEGLQTEKAETIKMRIGLELAEGFDEAVVAMQDIDDTARSLVPTLKGVALGVGVLNAELAAIAVAKGLQNLWAWMQAHPFGTVLGAQALAIAGVTAAWEDYQAQLGSVVDDALATHEWWNDATMAVEDAADSHVRASLLMRDLQRDIRAEEQSLADLQAAFENAIPGTREHINLQRQMAQATDWLVEAQERYLTIRGADTHVHDAETELAALQAELKTTSDEIASLESPIGRVTNALSNWMMIGYGGMPSDMVDATERIDELSEKQGQLRDQIDASTAQVHTYQAAWDNLVDTFDSAVDASAGLIPTDPTTLSEAAVAASDAITAAYRARAEAIYDAEVSAAQAREDLETETTDKIEDIQEQHKAALLETQRTYVDAALEQWMSYNEQLVGSDEQHKQALMQTEIAHVQQLMAQGGTYDEIVDMHDEWKARQLQNEINRNAAMQQDRTILHERLAEAEAQHADTLAEIDQDYHDQVLSETERFNEKLAELSEKRLDGLTDAAEAAYAAAQQEYAASLDASVAFVRDSEQAMAEWNEKRQTLAEQGAWCAIPEEEAAFAEQEAQRAAAYARQEDALRDHLGRELIEYVRAEALKADMSVEAMHRMTQAIADAYGVQMTPAEAMFAQDMATLDQIIASGGQGMDAWLAGADRRHEQAITQSLEREQRIDEEAEALAKLRIDGAISQDEYLARLAQVPTRIDTELGLTPQAPDESAALDTQRQYESDVEAAQADHQQTLADLEAAWQAQRQDAQVAHEEAVASIVDTYQREREEAMAAHQTALLQIELERVQGVYNAWLSEIGAWEDLATYRLDQLDLIQTQYDAEVQAAEIASEKRVAVELAGLETISEAREALANAAPGTFEADAWVEYYRNTQAIMARDLSIEQRQLLLDQERRRLREQLDQLAQARAEAEQRLVIPSDHPTSPVQILPPEHPPRQPVTIGHPAEEPIIHSPTRTPSPPPSTQETDYWSGGGYRRDVGAPGRYTAQDYATQPIIVNVTIQNPVIDTPAREQRLVEQMQRIAREDLRQQLDDVLKGGKGVSRRTQL